MIISFINGGLGNQMFQYALGRKLSLKRQTVFKLDILWFHPDLDGTAFRNYELRHFTIPIASATALEIEKVKEPFSNFAFKHIFSRFNARLPYYKRRLVEEKHFHFDPNMLNASGNAYLRGYWQSEKYFADIRETLLKDFTFKNGLKEKNLEMSQLINQSESVSLHIRRADYVRDKEVNRILGICPPEYYERAIQHIAGNTKNPVFFVFSDDIEWCRKNLKLQQETHFVDYNTGDASYRDMQLMSLCRHNIIANSSFSWWGAWLNNNPEKIVIAPARWFNDSTKNDTDLSPEKWLRM